MTSPGARYYFERRVIAVGVLMIVQGWIGIVLAHLLGEAFDLVTPFFQVVTASAFIAAASLNWSVRLKTSGAVMFATWATAALFAPWFFSNPIYPPTTFLQPRQASDWIDYGQQNLVLTAAAVVFYLYARQRMARPERLIA